MAKVRAGIGATFDIMKADKLYQHLDDDFITASMHDDWARQMDSIAEFLSDNYKHRSMGLVCHNATEIGSVFTAVFPSREVMQSVLSRAAQNAMLFVHHPVIWDIRKAPDVFQPMDRDLLRQFKDKNISIYNLHVPLDHYGDYSTSVTLARALGITPEKPFAPYFGGLAGVFGKTTAATVQELREIFQKAIGHDVRLYNYGDSQIKNGTAAVAAGGGLNETIEEISQNNVNVLVTGISAKNEYSAKAHEFAETHGINILGGTHYSTERFACVAMVDYFKNLGLASEFVEDKPLMEDMQTCSFRLQQEFPDA